MKAIKENRVYTVDENTKADYLARGFDIFDDGGKLIEHSPSGTVSRREYDELLAKYEALKAVGADPCVRPTGENTSNDMVAAEDHTSVTASKKGKKDVSDTR